ncbi:hypothetical protein Tco_0765167 [Tanacetum coccineum]
MPLGNASRIANILEPMTPRCSTVSNTPLSSNSFAARRDNSIQHRLWCLKHMTGNLKLLSNFMKKFLGTVKFKNDHIAPILGYGDLVQGNILEVLLFRKSTYTPPLNIQTTPETTSQAPAQAPTVTTTENINQADTHKENAQVEEDEFINIFNTSVHEQGETSS